MSAKRPQFRLFDFQEVNEYYDNYDEYREKKFLIKMFGMNTKGKTYCVYAKNFKPFFYIKGGDNWIKGREDVWLKFHLMDKLAAEPGCNDHWKNYISSCSLVKMKKLYGFDNFKKYNFVKVEFKNMMAFNKVKNFWYTNHKNFTKRKLRKNGYLFERTKTNLILYESNIPAMLRYFHVQEISPSGWCTFKKAVRKSVKAQKKTHCNYEYWTDASNILPLPNKEDGIPMKVMSFDIEASSSHGDFPVAKKTYRKLMGEIIQHWTVNKKNISKLNPVEKKDLFIDLVLSSFGFKNKKNKVYEDISEVYLKGSHSDKFVAPSRDEIYDKTNRLLGKTLGELLEKREPSKEEEYYEYRKWEQMDDEEKAKYKDWDMYIPHDVRKNNALYTLNMKYDAGKKLDLLDKAFMRHRMKKMLPSCFLPKLEGDKCTFIGSTFLELGEKEPYLNHMVVLSDEKVITPEVENSEVISKKTEKGLLRAWVKTIQLQDPDIIIGYNIFSFDWKFLIERAEELHILDDFLKMGRIKDEPDQIIESTTTVASGTYELKYVKILGRIQIDLLNYFRKNENLSSYKLDYVGQHFIGDDVKGYESLGETTVLKSKNLFGLKNGHYIVFEIKGHSSDKYLKGKKFKVKNLDLKNGSFEIDHRLDIDKKKKFRWCLAKDDIDHMDIFRLSKGGPEDKAIVAKYCYQDCNLVHNLFIKNDIFTAMVEQAAICSVPIEFVAMRGQGIKLLSFISKEARNAGMLIPVLEKSTSNDGYEGAIVLIPKCNLYRDNPVACNDYSSLYPSCMISENISHDSKVWTKEYDLKGKLIKITGEQDEEGRFIYDNLDEYKYVDVKYDTYEYVRKTPSSAAQKIKCGHKICRFVQFNGNDKGIMPTVLRELLASRKATRKLIKYKTVTLNDGTTYDGMLSKGDEFYTLVSNKGEKQEVLAADVVDVKDTYDDFMKNVFDKRQLAKKVVANSLYGQSGAKTSAFYDKDIAASTTAMGRKLLLYAKEVVEKCFDNKILDTKLGKVRTKSEYIYGDTDSVFFSFNLEDLDGNRIVDKDALKITIELAIRAGEIATKFLKPPHDLEYEKTFLPFLLLSKKRYVGLLYETDPEKCKMKSMGIVLKRRDNAACVKDCYGKVVDLLMKGETVDNAANFVRNYIKDMVDEKIPMEKLIISKSLNGFYKNPEAIAHKVLADRIGKRDPGSKPSVGSRVPFVYIQTKGKVKLQGDKIETPEFIKKNKLKPDYAFYITNQIMKPVTQIFSLLLNDMKEFKGSTKKNYERKIEGIKIKYKEKGEEKVEEKIQSLKDKMVKQLIFDDALRVCNNNKNNQKTLASFFKVK